MKTEVRPTLQWFIDKMEEKLRKHDATRGYEGWRKADPKVLYLNWFMGELDELRDAMFAYVQGQATADDVIGECVDVANMAHMLADLMQLTKTTAQKSTG